MKIQAIRATSNHTRIMHLYHGISTDRVPLLCLVKKANHPNKFTEIKIGLVLCTEEQIPTAAIYLLGRLAYFLLNRVSLKHLHPSIPGNHQPSLVEP